MAKPHRSIARSALINLAGAAVPAVLLLVTVPIFLHLIGAARYGVLAIVWLLLGYFSVFDLGFGRAIANRIAALHDAPPEQRQDVFWTGIAISFAASVVGGAILYLLGDWLFSVVFRVGGTLQIEAKDAMPWLVLALPVAVITSLLAGVLEGRQEFIALNSAQVFGTVLYQIFPLVMAYVGWITLPYLIAAAVIGRFLSTVLFFALSYHYVPLSSRVRFDRDHAIFMFRFGGWITLTGLISPLLTVFDRFLIGATLGAVAVTVYTVPYNLVMRVNVLSGSLQTALFPRFAMVSVSEAEALAARAVTAVAALTTPLVVIGLLLLKPFLIFWIGPKLGLRAAPIGEILLIGIWINNLAFIPFSYLQSRGRPDLPAKFHLVELLPFVGLLWLLLTRFGVAGAAWAWDARVLADAILLFGSTRAIFVFNLAQAGIVLVILAFALAMILKYNSPLYFVLSGVFAVSSVIFSVVSLPAELRSTALRRLSQKLNPIKP